MIYMGGKSRLAKHIVPFLLRHNPEVIIEPFVGGANITSEILKQGYKGRLVLSDLDASLMCMWYHVIYEGWLPTLETYPSREQYNEWREAAKRGEVPECNALMGWARTGASYSGKPWAGYVKPEDTRSGETIPYMVSRIRTSTTQFNLLHEHAESITLACCGYEAHTPHIPAGAVVYADPPYANTTAYDTEEFSHTHLWETLISWAQAGAHVYVSEESKPDWVDAEVVWEKIVNCGIRRKATDQGGGSASEKLYYLSPGE